MSKITDEIAALKKKLAELEEQERAEKEEARKRAAADKDKELTAIKNAIAAFNEKHNDTICLSVSDSDKELFSILYGLL